MSKIKPATKSQLQKVVDVATPDQMVSLVMIMIIGTFLPIIFKKGQNFSEMMNLLRPDYDYPSLEDFYYIPLFGLAIYGFKRL